MDEDDAEVTEARVRAATSRAFERCGVVGAYFWSRRDEADTRHKGDPAFRLTEADVLRWPSLAEGQGQLLVLHQDAEGFVTLAFV